MSNGLLAQWRRRIAGRGIAGALLLSVPVAVAAALGFSGAFSEFGSGLRAIGSIGGDSPDTEGPAPLNRVVITPAAGGAGTSDGGGAVDAGGAPGGGFGGGGSGGSGGGGTGGGGTGGGGTGGGTGGGDGIGGGGGAIPGTPSVDLPVDDAPGGSGSILDGVNDTVNGLLDGRN
jgi:hypothetical protein